MHFCVIHVHVFACWMILSRSPVETEIKVNVATNKATQLGLEPMIGIEFLRFTTMQAEVCHCAGELTDISVRAIYVIYGHGSFRNLPMGSFTPDWTTDPLKSKQNVVC